MKQNISKTLKTVTLMIFGSFLTAMGVSLFLLPNKIVCGGASGVATILYHIMSIPPGVTLYAFNGILLLLGWKILGTKFVLKTIAGAGIFSLMVQLLSYLPPITNDIVIGSIFGGILYGFGIGIVLASGASTGGTDILGRIIQNKFSYLPIGKVLMIVDGAIILTSLITFRQIDVAFYGIFALFVESFAIDWLIKKLNVSKIAFVITEKGNEISEKIVTTSPRGVTIIDVVGGYTMENKQMLFCALKAGELEGFQNKIKAIDNEAFVVFAESQQIVGNGFYVYR